ncbi:uncharacterized protein LOC126560861 [Anopheles maculipalpis]|uniref:uncharacterized protein LOC126560861 n=1 Tax=Anopheles maculipalpis TaxID=1496333 RepID=UPI0021593EC0|nr:uncharacterized protein LOC126560861 [Anopheles maculipalpis]
MSRLLGDTALVAVQTTAKLNRVSGPLNTNSKMAYCLKPTPPPEKKWLYKQLLESINSGISPPLNLSNSTLGRATSQMWMQLGIAHRRAQDIAEEYHLKEKVGVMMRQMTQAIVAVKDFIVQKQYYQLDQIIDKGLLALEQKIRATRENQLAVMDDATKPSSQVGPCPPPKVTGGAKVVMKNCTTIVVKRDPCMGDPTHRTGVKDVSKPMEALSNKL